MSHRITIKPTQDKRIVVQQVEYGPIAPGMIKKVSVQVRVAEDEPAGSIRETIQILTKHDIFQIPVTATIVEFDKFDEENKNQLEQTGRPI